MRDWLIVRLIDTATGVALLSGILHPTTVVNTVTNLASLGQDKRQSRIRNQENLRRKGRICERHRFNKSYTPQA